MKSLLFVSTIAFISLSTTFATGEDDIFGNLDAAKTTATTAATNKLHGAGEIAIENISYTFDDKSNYTVTWTALVGTTKVDVYIKNNDVDQDYTKFQTVNGSVGSVMVTLTSKGNYSIKMIPVDDLSTPLGKEYVQTIKVEGANIAPNAPASTPTAPAIPTAAENVKVWPGTNILIAMMIVISLVYSIYRFRKN